MRTEFVCISILRVASDPRVKLAGCKCVAAVKSLLVHHQIAGYILFPLESLNPS